MVCSECVLKVGHSGHFSGCLRVDILTSATDKRMRSPMKKKTREDDRELGSGHREETDDTELN